MNITYRHIEAATAILSQIAFSRGEDSDPTETLADWRKEEGFEEAALEIAANASASDSVEEIEQGIRDGGEFTMMQLHEYLEREYLTALQIGWILRARKDKRDEEAATDAS